MLYPTTPTSVAWPVPHDACALYLNHHAKLELQSMPKCWSNFNTEHGQTTWNYTLHADYKNKRTTTVLKLIFCTKSVVQDIAWKMCSCSMDQEMTCMYGNWNAHCSVLVKPDLRHKPI
jgi:hypothetical protein